MMDKRRNAYSAFMHALRKLREALRRSWIDRQELEKVNERANQLLCAAEQTRDEHKDRAMSVVVVMTAADADPSMQQSVENDAQCIMRALYLSEYAVYKTKQGNIRMINTAIYKRDCAIKNVVEARRCVKVAGRNIRDAKREFRVVNRGLHMCDTE